MVMVMVMGMGMVMVTAIRLFTGATNRPQELDEAARRRLIKRRFRIYEMVMVMVMVMYFIRTLHSTPRHGFKESSHYALTSQ